MMQSCVQKQSGLDYAFTGNFFFLYPAALPFSYGKDDVTGIINTGPCLNLCHFHVKAQA